MRVIGRRVVRARRIVIGGGPVGHELVRRRDRLPGVPDRGPEPDHDTLWVAPDAGFWPEINIDEMGQPGSHLTSNARRAHGDRAYQEPFMNKRRFVADLQRDIAEAAAGDSIRRVLSQVVRVKKWDVGEFEVTLRGGFTLVGAQILLGIGAGPQARLSPEVEIIGRPSRPRRDFPEVMSIIDFLSQPQISAGENVLFPSGGQSAMWGAQVTRQAGGHPLLVADEKFGGFATASANGRNRRIMEALAEHGMFLGALDGIEFLGNRDLEDGATPGLAVNFRGLRHHKDTNQAGRPGTLFVSKVVVATGADPYGPGGPLAILDPATRAALDPVWDWQGLVQKDPGATAFGMATPEFDLIVAGASGAKALEVFGHRARFESNALVLPPGARPYEGIGMSIATIAAMQDAEKTANWVITDAGINFYLASRAELKHWARQSMPGGSEKHAEEVAQVFIDERVKPGFDNVKIAEVINDSIPIGPVFTSAGKSTEPTSDAGTVGEKV